MYMHECILICIVNVNLFCDKNVCHHLYIPGNIKAKNCFVDFVVSYDILQCRLYTPVKNQKRDKKRSSTKAVKRMTCLGQRHVVQA